ncbi:MAG: glycosyltransferase family 39 protein [Ilumatobacteraceae bacterium]
MFAPISADEGGFLAIARAWRHGGTLYSDIWVDRPQGLIVLYRLFDTFSAGNEDGVRVLALLAGVVAVVAVAEFVRLLSNPTAGVAAGVLTAVLSSAPAIEGFAANGELLGGTCSAVALALGARVLSDRGRPGWMFAAGVAGGLGMSMKQSGIDGVAALLAFLALAAMLGWMPRGIALHRLAQVLAGAASVVLLMALHGLLTGWSQWVYAVNGYRMEQRSVFVEAEWGRLGQTWHDAWPVLTPPLLMATVIGVGAAVSGILTGRVAVMPGTVPRGPVLLGLWCVTALASFVSGGQFFHHYWVILSLPIAAASGLAIGLLSRRRIRIAVCTAVIAPAMWSWGSLAVLSRDEIPVTISGYGRSVQEERVGHWFADTAAPGESIYVMCASASVYAHADSDPPYPYLWFDNVHHVPGAMDRLADMLEEPGRPTYVAVFQRAGACDWSGRAGEMLERSYHRLTVVDGVSIFVAGQPAIDPLLTG